MPSGVGASEVFETSDEVGSETSERVGSQVFFWKISNQTMCFPISCDTFMRLLQIFSKVARILFGTGFCEMWHSHCHQNVRSSGFGRIQLSNRRPADCCLFCHLHTHVFDFVSALVWCQSKNFFNIVPALTHGRNVCV